MLWFSMFLQCILGESGCILDGYESEDEDHGMKTPSNPATPGTPATPNTPASDETDRSAFRWVDMNNMISAYTYWR